MQRTFAAIVALLTLSASAWALGPESFYTDYGTTSGSGGGGGGAITSGSTITASATQILVGDGAGNAVGYVGLTYASATQITSATNLRAQTSFFGSAASSQTGNMLINSVSGVQNGGLRIVNGNTNIFEMYTSGLGVALRSERADPVQFINSSNIPMLTIDPSNTFVGIGPSFSTVVRPATALEVQGTISTTTVKIGPCTTSQVCTSANLNSYCSGQTTGTLYRCDGNGSFSPVLYGTKVSNTSIN